MERIKFTINNSKLRVSELDGRKHYVAPAAILEEGVWEGSGGRLYYPGSDLQSSVPAWNHKPVVVYHPKDGETHISAANQQVLNSSRIGILLGTEYDSKLRTECWIDIEKANSVDKRVIQKIEAGETIEVSTGLFTDNEMIKGEFNGKEYDAVARNYRPDHLAILPDQLGAYPVSAGGGLMVTNTDDKQPARIREILAGTANYALSNLGITFVNNELSFTDVYQQISSLLAETFGKKGEYWRGYIVDVYDNYVVFYSEGPDNKLYAIEYQVKNDNVTFTGDAHEVQKVVSYQALAGSYVGNGRSLVLQPKEPQMAFDKKSHIDSLIGNGWEEAERESLMALSDSVLQKIKPNTVVANTKPDPIPEPIKAKPVTLDDVLVNGTSNDRQWIKRMREQENQRKTAAVAVIVGNSRNKFTKEFLETLETEQLEGMAQLCSTDSTSNGELPPMFIGNTGAFHTTVNNANIPDLPLPETFGDDSSNN